MLDLPSSQFGVSRMLIQHKESIMEIFALIALASAGSATLILDKELSAQFDESEVLNRSNGIVNTSRFRDFTAPDVESMTPEQPNANVAVTSSCRIQTAWCEAEILLLNLNEESRPLAPSPIP